MVVELFINLFIGESNLRCRQTVTGRIAMLKQKQKENVSYLALLKLHLTLNPAA